MIKNFFKKSPISSSIKKGSGLFLAVTLFLGITPLTFASFNDVTLTTSTIINIGGFDLTVSGSSAVIESISVGATSFDVTLLSGSSFAVTSADDKHFVVSATPTISYTEACPNATSSLTFGSAAVSTIATVSLSGTCAPVDNTPPPPINGGGGSIYYAPPTPMPTPVSPVISNSGTTTLPAIPTTHGTSTSVSLISKELSLGNENTDVRKAQLILSSEFPNVLPPTTINGFFGKKTEAAVKEFQCKYKIVCSGSAKTTGWGKVGKKTVKVINQLLAATQGQTLQPVPVAPTSMASSASKVTFVSTLRVGMENKEVQNLQIVLSKQFPDIISATSSISYFGLKTTEAVKQFQCKYKIACSGTPSTTGWGVVGKKTRDALNALSGN